VRVQPVSGATTATPATAVSIASCGRFVVAMPPRPKSPTGRGRNGLEQASPMPPVTTEQSWSRSAMGPLNRTPAGFSSGSRYSRCCMFARRERERQQRLRVSRGGGWGAAGRLAATDLQSAQPSHPVARGRCRSRGHGAEAEHGDARRQVTERAGAEEIAKRTVRVLKACVQGAASSFSARRLEPCSNAGRGDCGRVRVEERQRANGTRRSG
jgi:hypothetical protein